MKIILAGIGGGFGAALAIIIVVFWTGATFGQRCVEKLRLGK
jgi:hypothetical protein